MNDKNKVIFFSRVNYLWKHYVQLILIQVLCFGKRNWIYLKFKKHFLLIQIIKDFIYLFQKNKIILECFAWHAKYCLKMYDQWSEETKFDCCWFLFLFFSMFKCMYIQKKRNPCLVWSMYLLFDKFWFHMRVKISKYEFRFKQKKSWCIWKLRSWIVFLFVERKLKE